MSLPKTINDLSSASVISAEVYVPVWASGFTRKTTLSALGIGIGLPTSIKDPQYGAVGDGITDDTAAVNLAAASGQTIFVPDGTYLFPGASGGLILQNGTRFIGSSKITAIFRFSGSYTDSMIRSSVRDANDANNYIVCGLENLQLDVTTTSAVACLDCAGMRASKFNLLNMDGSGPGNGQTALRIDDRNPAGTSVASCFFNEFSSIDGGGSGWGIWAGGRS